MCNKGGKKMKLEKGKGRWGVTAADDNKNNHKKKNAMEKDTNCREDCEKFQ